MSGELSSDDFRSAIGRLPAGVAVITLRWRDTVHAMTASAVASVSLEPPMLLFCVHVDARFRDALDDVDAWAVSVLADDQAHTADWLASPGRPAFDQLARVPHRPGPAVRWRLARRRGRLVRLPDVRDPPRRGPRRRRRRRAGRGARATRRRGSRAPARTGPARALTPLSDSAGFRRTPSARLVDML